MDPRAMAVQFSTISRNLQCPNEWYAPTKMMLPSNLSSS